MSSRTFEFEGGVGFYRFIVTFIVFNSCVVWAVPENCHRHWQKFSNLPFQCELYTETGLPKTLYGSEVRLYRYSDGWNDAIDQKELLSAVTDSILSAVPAYVSRVALPNMHFILYNEFHDKHFAETEWQLSNSTEPCLVRLFLNIPDNRELAKQIVAHEIFHCGQRYGIVALTSEEPTSFGTSPLWWVEGSANYFSSLVFPSGNFEVSSKFFNPSVPLYFQPNPYATGLFFASLNQNNFVTPEEIVSLLKRQPAQSTVVAERKALSEWPKIGSLFHRFAERLTSKTITGAYGKAMEHPVLPLVVPLDVEPQWPNLGFKVVPFTVFRVTLRFPAGTKLSVVAPANLHDLGVRVSFRPDPQTVWMELNPDREFLVDVPCLKKDGEDWELVITSTRDSLEAVPFDLEFRDKKKKECVCKQTSLPVDSCLNGRWRLDNSKMAIWLADLFSPGGSDFKVTGAYEMAVSADEEALFNYRGFETSMMLQMDGVKKPWVQTINGEATYQIFPETPGSLCLQPQSVNGTVKLKIGDEQGEEPLASIIENMPDGEPPRIFYNCRSRDLEVWYEDEFGLKAVEWYFHKL